MPDTIRDAGPDDAELIARLVREAFLTVAERFDFPPEQWHPSTYTRQRAEQDLAEGKRFLILEHAGEACGCVAVSHPEPDVCEVHRLAVLPEHRRQGLGDALMRHALTEARTLGAHTVQLAIIADHVELQQWYERRGFGVVSRQRFEHLPFEVTFMRRELDAEA